MSKDLIYLRDKDSNNPIAVKAGDLIFISGQMAFESEIGVPDSLKLHEGMPHHGSLIEKQLKFIYGKLEKNLNDVDTSLGHILKINSFHRHGEDVDMALRERRNWFNKDNPPPSTLVFTPELPVRDARVSLDMINIAKSASMPIESVKLTKSPDIAQVKSIGWAVFSQVLKGAGFIFTRGTTAHNQDGPLKETLPDYPFPYDNSIVKYQLRYEIERMKDLLEDAGASLDHVVKAELHMTNMEDIAIVDELWKEYFPVNPPARVIIPVPLVVLPMRIESEFIAVDPNGPYKKEIINCKNLPKPLSPESIAVKAGPYLFISGQMATDYNNGIAPEALPSSGLPYHSNQARLEAKYIINNVKEICKYAGTSISNLVRRRVHFTDLYDMPLTEDLWLRELGDRMPASTTFKTSGPLPVPACKVQYDLTAYIP
tara:strand:+ start:6789 stop:8072 length:1284 start_codon:yes stop_codon:yes gene_type:complete